MSVAASRKKNGTMQEVPFLRTFLLEWALERSRSAGTAHEARAQERLAGRGYGARSRLPLGRECEPFVVVAASEPQPSTNSRNRAPGTIGRKPGAGFSAAEISL